MSACFDITDCKSYDNRSGLQILNSGDSGITNPEQRGELPVI